MSNVKCKVVKLSELLSHEEGERQFKELIETQWLEVDHRRKTSDLDVDFSKYLKLEELGVHYIVLAYLKAELVGYNSMFSAESPHTGELTATTDTIFIKKGYRKGGLGSEMVRLAEEEAKSRGCKHIMVTFKNSSPHPSIVEDLGFFSYETIYSKYIGE